MDRVPVDSEALSSVGYEDGVLEIEFSSGGVYLYFDVPQGVHEALMRADSHGQFFSRQIRDRFRYARVSEAGAPVAVGDRASRLRVVRVERDRRRIA